MHTVLRMSVIAGLQYLRWSQLVPMLLAWTVLLLMVGLMSLVSFQEPAFRYLERTEGWWGPLLGSPEGLPASDETTPADAGATPAESGDHAIRWDEDDIFPWVIRAWMLLALVGMLLDLMLRGRFSPWPARLRGRLALAGVAAALVSGAFFANYRFGSETFHGSLSSWVPLFVLMPLGVWVISAWSLCISAFVGHVIEHIDGPLQS